MLVPGENGYPEIFERLLRRAPSLTYQGDIRILNQTPRVAVIGRSRAGRVEQEVARRVGAALAAEAVPVVSGFARGVDQAAQLGALQVGGRSISFLPFGLEQRVLPERFSPFLSELLEMSQFAEDAQFTGSRALQRNALVSALSDAVFVVSADNPNARGSGAFQTAEIGQRHGTPLFVVDPRVFAASGVQPPPGNAYILGMGATPISKVEDIPGILRGFPPERVEQLALALHCD